MNIWNIIQTASGFIAGATSTIICHPLQIIQVQQQVLKNKQSITETAKNIYNKQGIKGYYYGIYRGILCYSIFYETYFYTYDYLKKSTNLGPFITSYLASGIGSIISNPWHVVRVRRQTCILKNELNLKPSIIKIYKNEGIGPLFKGLKTTLFKNIELGIIMVIYEKLRDDYKINPIYASFSGKLIASSLTYPLDTARNIRRYEPISHTEVIKRFKLNPKLMYNGISIYLIKSVPSCIIAFSVNQYIRN